METLVVVIEFFRRNVQFPVDHSKEVALHGVEVLQGDCSSLRDELVCEVSVVVRLRCQ